ncbi:MAG: hypothetical protein AAGD38_10005 [Acidobacteriota bacterium]
MTDIKLIVKRSLFPSLLVLIAVACGAASGPTETTLPDMSTVAAEDGWERYDEPKRYVVADVATVNPSLGSPEAAVVKYLASKSRGDELWREAMVPGWEDNGRLVRQQARTATWKVLSFELRARKPTGNDLWVKTHVELEIDGDRDGGEDEFELTQVDGVWRISRPPV